MPSVALLLIMWNFIFNKMALLFLLTANGLLISKHFVFNTNTHWWKNKFHHSKVSVKSKYFQAFAWKKKRGQQSHRHQQRFKCHYNNHLRQNKLQHNCWWYQTTTKKVEKSRPAYSDIDLNRANFWMICRLPLAC